MPRDAVAPSGPDVVDWLGALIMSFIGLEITQAMIARRKVALAA
jgi:hypothetical protein